VTIKFAHSSLESNLQTADRQRLAIDAMPATLLREVFGGFAG